ncbi:hypothetical protein C8R46DRAFT_1092070 [Mycena filopes]|nr:hypothetical protein C8R46DRAFT_1092070 [Mycena filopes]
MASLHENKSYSSLFLTTGGYHLHCEGCRANSYRTFSWNARKQSRPVWISVDSRRRSQVAARPSLPVLASGRPFYASRLESLRDPLGTKITPAAFKDRYCCGSNVLPAPLDINFDPFSFTVTKECSSLKPSSVQPVVDRPRASTELCRFQLRGPCPTSFPQLQKLNLVAGKWGPILPGRPTLGHTCRRPGHCRQWPLPHPRLSASTDHQTVLVVCTARRVLQMLECPAPVGLVDLSISDCKVSTPPDAHCRQQTLPFLGN